MTDLGFTRQELRRLRALRSPVGIQRALDNINLRGDRTLRAYSRPLNLARFDRSHPGWMTTEADLWWIPEYLVGLPHTHLLAPGMERSLSRTDRRALEAGLVGYRAK